MVRSNALAATVRMHSDSLHSVEDSSLGLHECCYKSYLCFA
jgi:hypothetical protein